MGADVSKTGSDDGSAIDIGRAARRSEAGVTMMRVGTIGSALRGVLLRFHGRIQATFISCDVRARREPIDGRD